jgi:glycosyltransferase involved in cell wall biosynthesis
MDMKEDKISIIMPCYNSQAYLFESIKSSLEQTYKNIELIIVNDGSTDRSYDIIKNFKDSRIRLINQPNLGVSVARNKGLDSSTGKFIAFLDSDDFWRHDCLERLYNALKSEPDAVLSYCGWQNLGLKGGEGEPYIPPDYEQENKLQNLLRSCPWPIHAALTRREAIESAGLFDESLTNSEDYKLWLHIASFNKIVRVPEVLAYYRFHEGQQASKNQARAAEQRLSVKKEFLKKYSEIIMQLGYPLIKQLTIGELLKSGYICYWKRDIRAARKIFRKVMKQGYGSFKDWKYMLPSILPFFIHNFIIRFFDRKSNSNKASGV